MPKNTGKGGNKRKKGKKPVLQEDRELRFANESEEYAQITKILGDGRFQCKCADGIDRIAHVRGKFRKRVWLANGDIILVSLREFEPEKCDVVEKYKDKELAKLKSNGEIPDSFTLPSSSNEEKENIGESDIKFEEEEKVVTKKNEDSNGFEIVSEEENEENENEEKKENVSNEKEKEKEEEDKKEEEEKDKNEIKEENKIEENKENIDDVKEDEDKNKNNKDVDKKSDEEEFIIDTSTKNNNNTGVKKVTKEEIKTEEEDEKENDINDNKIENQNNDSIYKIIKKLKKARRGSICQELTIKEDECDYVIDKSYEIFQKEESLLKIKAPLYICGDIHGQYYDLLRVFDILNYPPQSTFLFLGDYVDRGKQSLECLLLLLCLKIQYPDKIFLLRGNHECEALNKIYGFYDECKRRLSIKCFKKITNLFNMMPISALINENILCMHGGLSKDLQNIEQINKILRPTDIPNEGLLCDLLWSDPNESLTEDFGSNERNISVTFSKDYVKNFVEKNNLDLICRAHQVVEEGFEFFADMKLVTIFTAPNYMGEFDNNGGILEVGEDLLCKFHVLRPNFERSGKRRKITQLVN